MQYTIDPSTAQQAVQDWLELQAAGRIREFLERVSVEDRGARSGVFDLLGRLVEDRIPGFDQLTMMEGFYIRDLEDQVRDLARVLQCPSAALLPHMVAAWAGPTSRKLALEILHEMAEEERGHSPVVEHVPQPAPQKVERRRFNERRTA